MTPVPNNRPATREAYVQMPVQLLLNRQLSATAKALWCVLVDATYRAPSRKIGTRTRARLLRDLGMAGRDERTITRATAALAASGWLDVERRRVGDKTHNVYRPLQVPERGDGQAYVEVPRGALEQMRTAAVSAEQLRTLACWLHGCGRKGWTRDSFARFAEVYGTRYGTAREHRAVLVHCGLLEVQPMPGGPSITARPGALPDQWTPLAGGTLLSPSGPVDPAGRRHITPLADGTSPRWLKAPGKETSRKKNLPKEKPACGLSRRDLTSAVARTVEAPPPALQSKFDETRGKTARSASGRHREAEPVLAAILDVLAPMPTWFRPRVMDRLSRALDDGYGPRALVRAADEHFRAEAAHDRQHLAELQRMLGYLRSDVLAGACAECGQNSREGLAVEICPACNRDDATEVDPGELERLLSLLEPAQAVE